MSNLRSTFESILDHQIQVAADSLLAGGWLLETGLTPDLKVVRTQFGPQEVPLPDGLQFALTAAASVGTAWEWKGELANALAWYEFGALSWRGGRQFRHFMDEDPPDIGARSAAGGNQLKAAICADRVGELDRAKQLYGWANHNYSFTSQEVAYYREGQSQVLWEFLPFKAYALACLEDWEQALAVAEQVSRIVEADRRAQSSEAYREPLQVLAVVRALVRNEVDPSEENRRRAIEALDPQSVASRIHGSHLISLLYLYNLRARHPDLANPAPEELPPGERARRGSEACISWFARVGLTLDGTAESLRLLDSRAAEVGPYLTAVQDEKTAIFLLGSYLGEVIKAELAGGKWVFEGNDLAQWKLDWEMGEAGFHILPFKEAARRTRGDDKFRLYDVWTQAEQTYVRLGLNAKYAD